jgi:hypothetical protein
LRPVLLENGRVSDYSFAVSLTHAAQADKN